MKNLKLFKKTPLALCLLPILAMANEGQVGDVESTVNEVHAQLASNILIPEQIEQKLANASNDNAFYQIASIGKDDAISEDAKFISQNVQTIGTSNPPIGLDESLVTKLPTYESTLAKISEEQAEEELTPEKLLPQYQYQEQTQVATETPEKTQVKESGIFKKLYNKVFNDGVESVDKLDVTIYQGGERVSWDKQVADLDEFNKLRETIMERRQNNVKATDGTSKISRKTAKGEPYANIKAALEDIATDSILNGNPMPRLRQTVITAARAVGYYNLDFSIENRGAGNIDVVIHSLGDPVVVENNVLAVWGEGSEDKAYTTAVENAPLKKGDVFHHGKYEANKSSIVDVSGEHGYFDGKWLNSSAEVILPDNVADVNLVYDTGAQYQFDEVVFFTTDKETGGLTTDPAKLPVKPELLKKLLTFNLGDAYNRTATQNLSNNLLATGYFNAVNTEIVLPSQVAQAGIDFEESAGDGTKTKEAEAGETDQTGEKLDLGEGVTANISPIEFNTSQAITEKLALVTQKAEQLYRAPDDRLLITDSSKSSKSLLGRVSDAVSNVVKAILPDETTDVLPVMEDGQKPMELANKKDGQQVFADKKIPLYIFVMSDKPRDAQIGLGWGSDSGARLITKVEHKLLNRHGMQAGADVRLSQRNQGVELYTTRPLSHPLNDKLKASLSYDEEKIDQGQGTFNLSSKTLETGLSRNIINPNGWNKTYSLRYRMDSLETDVAKELWKDLPVQFEGGKPTQEALLAGFAINKTVADNLVNPMRGYRQYYSLEGGVKGILTDTDMAIARAGVSGVYSFGENEYGKNRAHQLVSSLNLGYLWAKNFNDVPYKLRFFAGGDQSIRGYNYESLSPISDKGYLTGGQVLAVGSLEYNYEIMEGLRLGIFGDVGNAYDKDFNTDTKIGAGVGVRYSSPVGQVRVDVATGVGEQDTSIKLHFFIGTPF